MIRASRVPFGIPHPVMMDFRGQSEDLLFGLFSEEDDVSLLAVEPLSADVVAVEGPLVPLPADSAAGLSPDLSFDVSVALPLPEWA
ncbi:MAG: hypothetical protein ACREPW_01925 [Candidatus Binataceae bacterium]